MADLHKMVNGVKVALTAEEEADFYAREAAHLKRLEEDQANAYKSNREREYPSIGDQLDMLWHSMDNGEIPKSQAFFMALKAVKDKYPKTTTEGV